MFLLHSACLFFVALSGITAGQAPIVVQNYKNFHVLGCFADTVQNRVLRHFAGAPPNMTVETCLDICAANNFALGGVEFSTECYCGNAILFNAPTITDGSGCNMPCVGSQLEACGGAGSIEIYQNGNISFTTGTADFVLTHNDWIADGCFTDSPSRNVPVRLGLGIDNMTVEACLDGCEAANFNVAALQDGGECYCGNVPLPAGQTVCIDDCNAPCSGSATEFCGAPDRNWVLFLPSALNNSVA